MAPCRCRGCASQNSLIYMLVLVYRNAWVSQSNFAPFFDSTRLHPTVVAISPPATLDRRHVIVL